MELKRFMKRVNSAKKINKTTGSFMMRTLYNSTTNIYEIYLLSDSHIALRVAFKKPHELTVFESELLLMLFCQKRLPLDYARFDRCKSGIDFIDNIEAIWLRYVEEHYIFREVN